MLTMPFQRKGIDPGKKCLSMRINFMETTEIQIYRRLCFLFYSLSNSILPHKFLTKIAIITETILSNKAIFPTEVHGSMEKFLPGYSNMAIQIHFLQSKWQERYLILIPTC